MVFEKIIETCYEIVMNNPVRLERFSNTKGVNGPKKSFFSLLVTERRW